MSKSPAHSGSTSGGPASVVIIGATAQAKAFENLCAARGVTATVLPAAENGHLPAGGAATLSACDLFIDASLPETPGKTHVLREAEAALPDTALIATVALHRRIGPFAGSLARPANFAGLGIARGPQDQAVVEVVKTPASSDETVRRLVELMDRIGGNPIIVADSPGFFSVRTSNSYFNEAMALVGEGVPATAVEDAALESGLAAGPLALLDDMSLKLSDDLLHQELHDLEQEAAGHGGEAEHGDDHGHGHAHGHDHDHDHDHAHGQDHGHGKQHEHAHDHDHAHDHGHEHDHPHPHGAAPKAAHAHKHDHRAKSKQMPEPAVYVMEKMAHGFRRMGREAGAGFYEYDDDGSASLWSGLKAFERRSTKIPAQDIRDRLLFIQALEAVRCLDDGVIASLADADAALVLAGRFPAAAGGPGPFINRMGTRAFVERAKALAVSYGDRFQPPARLVQLASRNLPLDDQPAASPKHR